MTLDRIGERVAYRAAGAAHRQANRRACAASLSETDMRVLAVVLELTVSYSKLTDSVAHSQLTDRCACSPRQLRRSLRRLVECGVIAYQPGRGRGNSSIIGVPPEGKNADEYLSSLLDREDGEKRTELVVEKADTLRARAKETEKDPEKKTLVDEPTADDGVRHLEALRSALWPEERSDTAIAIASFRNGIDGPRPCAA